jgi:hypothetical protein
MYFSVASNHDNNKTLFHFIVLPQLHSSTMLSASSILNQTTTASTELHHPLKAHEDYGCVFGALEHKKYTKKPVKLTFLHSNDNNARL